MSQVVGKNCVICAKRINSILEGKFCPACTHPVHMDCTLADVPKAESRCNVCGGPITPSVKAGVSPPRSGDREGSGVLATYWALRLFLGAVLCFTLGIAFLFVPQLRDNPNQLAMQELLLGGGLMVGGLVFIALTVRFLRRH